VADARAKAFRSSISLGRTLRREIATAALSVLKDSPIHKAADLTGKVVAVSGLKRPDVLRNAGVDRINTAATRPP